MPSPLPNIPGKTGARPLFITIASILMIIGAAIVLVLLLVGGFLAFTVVSTLSVAGIIFIMAVGVVSVALQIAAAVGMLLMKQWAYWLVLIVFVISLIVPLRETFGGTFSVSSWLAPLFLGIVFGYLHKIKKVLR